MKTSSALNKIIPTIAIPLMVLYVIFVNTNLFVPSQTEVENQKDLLMSVISEIASETTCSDTLYLITDKVNNRPESESEPPIFKSKLDQIAYNKANPFVIKEKFDKAYNINNKIIIIDTANYISQKENIIDNAHITYLSLLPQSKNEVLISIKNICDSAQFNLVYKDNKWIKNR